MTLPSHYVRTICARGLLCSKSAFRAHSGINSSNYLLNKCSDRKPDLRVVSRYFSLEVLGNYPVAIFNKVADSNACAFTKDVFVNIHDLSGLPWWCTIISSAALLKLYSLPWTLYQIKLLDRLNTVNKEMPKISNKALIETGIKQRQYHWTMERAKRMHRKKVMLERRQLILKHNCHPLKIILTGYMELPLWIVMSVTWRTMAYGFSEDITSSILLISQMVAEGPFWCVNLTQPDSTLILSSLIALSHLAVIELSQIQAQLLKKKLGTIQKILVNLNRCFGILAAVVCSFMPSSVGMFWLSSISLTLLRDLVLVSRKVRRNLKLPYQSFSYREIFETFKSKFSWTKV